MRSPLESGSDVLGCQLSTCLLDMLYQATHVAVVHLRQQAVLGFLSSAQGSSKCSS